MAKKEILKKRAQIISDIRSFFIDHGYLEVETPKLVKYSGQDFNIESFKTRVFNERDEEYTGYLITSPEFSCKKLLSEGHDKIFELGKCFRNNEPFGKFHNPEFTMLEWYSAGSNYFDLMDETESLVKLLGKETLNYQGEIFDLTSPWKRMTMADAFKEYADIDLADSLERDKLYKEAKRIRLNISSEDDFEEIFNNIVVSKIEPNLPKDPVFIYDFPVELGSLARAKKEDPRFAERAELYIAGLEISNGFSELNDSHEQEARFLEEQKKRERLGKEVHAIDPDFIKALASMPPSAGNALGIDRLVMLLTDSADISDVISFSAKDIFSK